MAGRNRPRKKKANVAVEPDRKLSLKETHFKNGGTEKSWWDLLHKITPGFVLCHNNARTKVVLRKTNKRFL